MMVQELLAAPSSSLHFKVLAKWLRKTFEFPLANHGSYRFCLLVYYYYWSSYRAYISNYARLLVHSGVVARWKITLIHLGGELQNSMVGCAISESPLFHKMHRCMCQTKLKLSRKQVYLHNIGSTLIVGGQTECRMQLDWTKCWIICKKTVVLRKQNAEWPIFSILYFCSF